MIGFASDKVEKEWAQAAVALRLVVEALDLEFGGACFVFRLDAPTKFENGCHATGRAADVELRGATEEEMERLVVLMNQKFPAKGLADPTYRLKFNRANFPSGRRNDRPHVHVQILFDWLSDPRRFLRDHGFIQSES